ncbi:MAG: hypothetical protein R3264_08835 [Anaerolineae bacterium]|nr:hypothetical protein [Anaerolineae bacterium]
MDIDWKRIVGFFLRVFVLLILIIPIALWFSIKPALVLYGLIGLALAWRNWDVVLARLRRASAIVIITLLGFVVLGIVAWLIQGSFTELVTTVVVGAFIIFLAVAFNE